jgi:DSBA-like thioredoxin domain
LTGAHSVERINVNVEFWIDPICPWCWVTARWVVERVEQERQLDITWQPISLYFKNEPEEGSRFYEPSLFTHRLLRVMESVRSAEGDGAVQGLYWEYGRRIHHDGDRGFDPAEALAAAGLDAGHAPAFDDETWDKVIRERMDEGLALAGDQIGTPLIGFVNGLGKKVAYFGPVITRVPEREDALALWDGLTRLATVDGFWELKRTRTESPDLGQRP